MAVTSSAFIILLWSLVVNSFALAELTIDGGNVLRHIISQAYRNYSIQVGCGQVHTRQVTCVQCALKASSAALRSIWAYGDSDLSMSGNRPADTDCRISDWPFRSQLLMVMRFVRSGQRGGRWKPDDEWISQRLSNLRPQAVRVLANVVVSSDLHEKTKLMCTQYQNRVGNKKWLTMHSRIQR